MKCRHCSSEVVLPFLDLGIAPPSNAYLTADQLQMPERYIPLRLLVCETCWLVQTEDFADREELFCGDYAYFSSFSESWLVHAQKYWEDMSRRFSLDGASCVAEIAANDGYLLQYVKASGVPCYGIEPTAGTASAAKQKGLEIVERFFGLALARELVSRGKSADLIPANNVLAHVPDINDFVSGVAHLLNPGGVATFEFPHLVQMVQDHLFDTAYHEHYSYLSFTAVVRICAANGLPVFDVEELPTHGGSLRVFAQREDTGCQPLSQRVDKRLKKEAALGLRSASFYRGFQGVAEKVKDDLLLFLIDAKRRNWKVAAYGAAAKGNTLMNFAGIRSDLVRFVSDRNPSKQGKFMPGSRIPIFGEDRLREEMPDVIVLIPWNLKAELLHQLEYAREWGARFVAALPELEVHT